MKKKLFIGLTGFLQILLVGAAVDAQQSGPVVYPSKGQSQAQTEQDKNACYGWAKQQTGFDPAAALQSQQTQTQAGAQNRRGALSGAAKGAAGGAAGGAIAGDAGKGAAIGGAAGGIAGARKQRKAEKEQKQAAAGQQQTQSRNLADYNKAFSACMEGRGYTVK